MLESLADVFGNCHTSAFNIQVSLNCVNGKEVENSPREQL